MVKAAQYFLVNFMFLIANIFIALMKGYIFSCLCYNAIKKLVFSYQSCNKFSFFFCFSLSYYTTHHTNNNSGKALYKYCVHIFCSWFLFEIIQNFFFASSKFYQSKVYQTWYYTCINLNEILRKRETWIYQKNDIIYGFLFVIKLLMMLHMVSMKVNLLQLPYLP